MQRNSLTPRHKIPLLVECAAIQRGPTRIGRLGDLRDGFDGLWNLIQTVRVCPLRFLEF